MRVVEIKKKLLITKGEIIFLKSRDKTIIKHEKKNK